MARQSASRTARGREARDRRSRLETTREDQVPEIYREMLEEAEARDPGQFQSDRPLKRRRVGDSESIQTRAIPVDSPPLEQVTVASSQDDGAIQNVQTIYDSTTSDESDVEWEDVEVTQSTQTLYGTTTTNVDRDEILQITLDRKPETRKRQTPRRKPVTAAEKKLRLDAHKVHLLCLLAHVSLRNRWCNDDLLQVRSSLLEMGRTYCLTDKQRSLKRMLPRKIIALLNPDESKPQFVRSTTFIDGLNQAGDVFNRRFRVTNSGLKRAHWAEDQEQLKQRMVNLSFVWHGRIRV